MLDAVTAPAFGTTAAGKTFYEFFAGAGMVRLGLGTDWTCLLANDNDVEKATSYARKSTVRALKIDDVACLTAADLPGRADLGWGSFPCQELSLAGGRAGLEGERSATFWDYWRQMMALRAEGRAPRLVVIENVCGLITGSAARISSPLRRLHGGRLSRRRHGDRRRAVRAAIAPARLRHRRRCDLADSASIVMDQPDPLFHDDAVVKALRRRKAAESGSSSRPRRRTA